MKVGDKVRLTKGTETGFIVGQAKNGIFDVDLDGFILQLHISEITVIEEAQFPEDDNEEEVPSESKPEGPGNNITNLDDSLQGLILNADFKDNSSVNLIINNNSNNTYHIFVFMVLNGIKHGFYSNILNNNSTINTRIKKDGSTAPTITIQFIKFNQNEPPQKLREYTINLNNKSEFDDINGHLYTLYLESDIKQSASGRTSLAKGRTSSTIDANQLKESLTGGKQKKSDSEISLTDEIDLHIEKLSEKHQTIPEDNILSIQLSAFQTALDNAIAKDLNHLTVIHGVGNGILRMEIHKRLAKRGDIAWFQDADKQKFGFGATFIQLK